MNHTCLRLPSRSWYSFTDLGGMEGWVGLDVYGNQVADMQFCLCVHWYMPTFKQMSDYCYFRFRCITSGQYWDALVLAIFQLFLRYFGSVVAWYTVFWGFLLLLRGTIWKTQRSAFFSVGDFFGIFMYHRQQNALFLNSKQLQPSVHDRQTNRPSQCLVPLPDYVSG